MSCPPHVATEASCCVRPSSPPGKPGLRAGRASGPRSAGSAWSLRGAAPHVPSQVSVHLQAKWGLSFPTRFHADRAAGVPAASGSTQGLGAILQGCCQQRGGWKGSQQVPQLYAHREGHDLGANGSTGTVRGRSTPRLFGRRPGPTAPPLKSGPDALQGLALSPRKRVQRHSFSDTGWGPGGTQLH